MVIGPVLVVGLVVLEVEVIVVLGLVVGLVLPGVASLPFYLLVFSFAVAHQALSLCF